MTAFDNAEKIAQAINQDKWKLGSNLRVAVDDEGRTIREFCVKVDGNYDHEDSYGNYVKADRFKDAIKDIPEYETLITLPISYFWNAWRGLESGLDFELLIEWLLDSFREGGGKTTVRVLQDKIKQALGNERTMDDYMRMLMRLWRRMKPTVIGRKSALSVSEAATAQAIEYHMSEIERLVNEPGQ